MPQTLPSVHRAVRGCGSAVTSSCPAFSTKVGLSWRERQANTNIITRPITIGSTSPGSLSEQLKAELATGKGDGEMLQWIEANAPDKRAPWEIQQWSAHFNERGPDGDVETLAFFAKRVGEFNKNREDVKTWFDLLDLDDHVTFGGNRSSCQRTTFLTSEGPLCPESVVDAQLLAAQRRLPR